MPPRDWKLRLEDILEALARVEVYIQGMDFETFVNDVRTQDAVIRNLGTIGEVANHVPAAIRMAHPEIPWPQMRALRNLVIHEYFGVNLEILWDTVQKDLGSSCWCIAGRGIDRGAFHESVRTTLLPGPPPADATGEATPAGPVGERRNVLAQ